MIPKYIFTNIIGSFVFDEKFKIVDKSDSEDKFSNKYPSLKKVSKEELRNILEEFKQKKYFQKFYEKNLLLAKQKVRESVIQDNLVIQAINVIEDLNKVINMLVTGLREWYELYNPEFSRYQQNNELFVKEILEKDKEKLLKEINIKETMGSDLKKMDLQAIIDLAKQINSLYLHKKNQEEYLERTIQELCPNMVTITGALIGAKLIEHAGSLEHLSELPASTIQLLGAEKALFRHMTTGARCPKFGVLFKHPFVSQAKKQMQGKIARVLADKISIAVKVDFFNGKFIGDQLLKDIKMRIQK